MAGAPYAAANRGAIWVYSRRDSVWRQQGRVLFSPRGEIGQALIGETGIALSDRGNTALIAGLNDDHDRGAVWVFQRDGSTWSQQGPKLTGAGEIGGGLFGGSVALSANGSTALIGAPWDNHDHGAAWLFARHGATWTQQGHNLTMPHESSGGEYGASDALSADGITAVVSAFYDNHRRGAAWVLTITR